MPSNAGQRASSWPQILKSNSRPHYWESSEARGPLIRLWNSQKDMLRNPRSPHIHETLESMRELAFHPAIKPIMEEGDVDMMKRIMDVLQGLATIKPQEGFQGAAYALRQAMSGVWRPMQYQYGIRPEHLAGAAGMTMEEFELSPAKSFKALETHVLAVTQPTTNLTAVINKLRDEL